MSVLPIARMGHPVLWQVAKPVPLPFDDHLRALAADMIETMHQARGVGLAAPQVFQPLRLFVFRVPAARGGGEEIGDTVLINPKVTLLSEPEALGWEGCLSIPGMRAVVPRADHIHYEGSGLDGEAISREAFGFHARVIQHEFDHLNGILYTLRVNDFTSFGFNDALDAAAEQERGEDGRGKDG
jgi:peptide deformylase